MNPMRTLSAGRSADGSALRLASRAAAAAWRLSAATPAAAHSSCRPAASSVTRSGSSPLPSPLKLPALRAIRTPPAEGRVPERLLPGSAPAAPPPEGPCVWACACRPVLAPPLLLGNRACGGRHDASWSPHKAGHAVLQLQMYDGRAVAGEHASRRQRVCGGTHGT
jgi:hypothetical protein